jgi:hypothetical protein
MSSFRSNRVLRRVKRLPKVKLGEEGGQDLILAKALYGKHWEGYREKAPTYLIPEAKVALDRFFGNAHHPQPTKLLAGAGEHLTNDLRQKLEQKLVEAAEPAASLIKSTWEQQARENKQKAELAAVAEQASQEQATNATSTIAEALLRNL